VKWTAIVTASALPMISFTGLAHAGTSVPSVTQTSPITSTLLAGSSVPPISSNGATVSLAPSSGTSTPVTHHTYSKHTYPTPIPHTHTTQHRSAGHATTEQTPLKVPIHARGAESSTPLHKVKAVPQHRRTAQPAAPEPGGTFYDSATPQNIPPHAPMAAYADGGYAASPQEVAGHHVMWIDTNGSDPRANALDIEPGDATPQQAAVWVQEHNQVEPGVKPVLYMSRGQWPAVQASVSSLPRYEQNKVLYWVADPGGPAHLPGAWATQYQWDGNQYDVDAAAP
jgi:hypothetical protein